MEITKNYVLRVVVTPRRRKRAGRRAVVVPEMMPALILTISVIRRAGSACSAGIVDRPWPSCRLITSSNVVGCSTGRSAGLAPLRILVHAGGGAAVYMSGKFAAIRT